MSLADHAELDAARHVGDREADAVIAALGDRVWVVNAALRHSHRNDDDFVEAVPVSVRRFFDERIALPAWFEPERARRARRWAKDHLFHIVTALFCASLPTAYAAPRGARILRGTGRMEGTDLDRRVNETAQFVLEVLAEDGSDPSGHALRSIGKVRLMHAAVRSHLACKLTEDEVPINQEDMLGTLFTFSLVVVRSTRLLGVEMSDDEADDFFHLWRAVGSMLGIEDRLLPESYDAALVLGRRIAGRQFGPSEHGRALTADLLAGIERHVSGMTWAPRHLMRYLVGDEIADHIGLPTDGAFQDRLLLLRFLPRMTSSPINALLRTLSPRIGRPLFHAVIAKKLSGAPADYAMPTSFSPTTS